MTPVAPQLCPVATLRLCTGHLSLRMVLFNNCVAHLPPPTCSMLYFFAPTPPASIGISSPPPPSPPLPSIGIHLCSAIQQYSPYIFFLVASVKARYVIYCFSGLSRPTTPQRGGCFLRAPGDTCSGQLSLGTGPTEISYNQAITPHLSVGGQGQFSSAQQAVGLLYGFKYNTPK